MMVAPGRRRRRQAQANRGCRGNATLHLSVTSCHSELCSYCSLQDATVVLYFHSHPAYGAAVAANILFLLLGLWSLYRTQRTGARYTLWLPITCFLETAGYAARLTFLRGPSKDCFIAQQVGAVLGAGALPAQLLAA